MIEKAMAAWEKDTKFFSIMEVIKSQEVPRAQVFNRWPIFDLRFLYLSPAID